MLHNILSSLGALLKTIKQIQVGRGVTDLGLKETKELVDSLHKPVKEGLPKEEAEELKAKFEDAGAQVDLS